ncbi:MAG: hypothetical protein US25_C0086G0008 [Candidatus Moranbacteria bacterium GW2011_GWE1_36_7]|nr:MAG: hypothetical protein UR99_C0034G0009 [Candidatus Moranbacteria bacterium GW2011_GWD2_36_12]KKQ11416.1 MAG: hypothetical protein US25_C0086G0008 [Candidatus Moranbacteria bacterium GW2011_GWE1_36_7]
MDKKLVEKRNSFITVAVENASLQALVALVLAPATMAQKVGNEIKKRISEDGNDCKEIPHWIELFTSMGSTLADTHTKDFFKVLHDSGYAFSMIDLKNFLLAFGIGRSHSDKVNKLFLQHEHTSESDILDVIDKLSPMSREYFFKKYLPEGRLSRLGYAHCMKYREIGSDAMKSFESISSSEIDDMNELKKHMLAALSNRDIYEDVFDYMLTLEMLSKEEVVALSEQDGMKQLAKRALKNNLQPHEED